MTELDDLLEQFRRGELDKEALKTRLLEAPYMDIGVAKLDLHRSLRTGQPETIYCGHKTTADVAAIFQALAERGADTARILGTRASQEQFAAVREAIADVTYDPVSRLLTLDRAPLDLTGEDAGHVLVMCAGTSDRGVAEEAAGTAEFFGSRVTRHFDCGVAGLHRLTKAIGVMQQANAVVVAAGMDGALPSVIGGLSPAPIVAVPTSVGYGTGLGGVAALMTMLNACAPGVSVVNIDNGYGAGYVAHKINRQSCQPAR